jgi:hypothetical protein
MLELRDAKLELVELVAGDEVELLDETAKESDGLLADARATSPYACRKLAEQLLDRFRQP